MNNSLCPCMKVGPDFIQKNKFSAGSPRPRRVLDEKGNCIPKFQRYAFFNCGHQFQTKKPFDNRKKCRKHKYELENYGVEKEYICQEHYFQDNKMITDALEIHEECNKSELCENLVPEPVESIFFCKTELPSDEVRFKMMRAKCDIVMKEKCPCAKHMEPACCSNYKKNLPCPDLDALKLQRMLAKQLEELNKGKSGDDDDDGDGRGRGRGKGDDDENGDGDGDGEDEQECIEGESEQSEDDECAERLNACSVFYRTLPPCPARLCSCGF